MAKLRLLRARRSAKPKVKPGRAKGTARDGSAARRHNSSGSARPSVCGGGLAGLINVSTINRIKVCVAGERRGAEGGERGKNNLKRS